MYKIFVRAKKDHDALQATINKFFKDWPIEIHTFKGYRTPGRVFEILESSVDEEHYNIVLLGREDSTLASLQKYFRENTIFYVIDYTRVRNARIWHIAQAFDNARALIRNTVGWNGRSYVFSHIGETFLRIDLPAADLFLGIGKGFTSLLKRYIRVELVTPLFLRLLGGEHRIFQGASLVAVLRIPDRGEVEVLREPDKTDYIVVKPNQLVEDNFRIIKLHERIALNLIKRNVEGDVIVPWSGGRDSTAVLLLTVKALGSKHVKAVYVDTGVDFDHEKYLQYVSSKLGVKLYRVRALVKEKLKDQGLPTHDNRWCTVLKIQALHNKIREVAGEKATIIVGDRDAESRPRSRRPPVRFENSFRVIAPIKNWSTALTQLYLLANKIPLNSLYYMGFYRMGCYICPALRSWELEILKDMKELYNKPFFKDFLRSRGLN
ncbi:MAG TPA: phosphoadenosine phosphosulfate reductase [Thermoproteales archaeon]|nr:phosphoadenosine phosphosulfate reductase [Thermoproteales archaeon]